MQDPEFELNGSETGLVFKCAHMSLPAFLPIRPFGNEILDGEEDVWRFVARRVRDGEKRFSLKPEIVIHECGCKGRITDSQWEWL